MDKIEIPEEVLNKRVCIGFTTRGNDIYFRTVFFLLNQLNVFKNLSVMAVAKLWGPGSEQLFKAMAEGPFDYLLFLDSDVAPRDDTLVRMILRDKDIVSCPVWMCDMGAKPHIHLNLHYGPDRQRVVTPKQEGLERVHSTSWACVGMKKRVLEMFLQTGESFTQWSDLIDERFKNLEPDNMFFEKCNALGFEVYMDWDLEFAIHHKYVGLSAPVLEEFVARRLYGFQEGEFMQRAGRVLSGREAPVPH